MATKAHPGFKGAARSIAAREHLPVSRANAILAAGSRNSSEAAKKKNPRLRKVKGDGDGY